MNRQVRLGLESTMVALIFGCAPANRQGTASFQSGAHMPHTASAGSATYDFTFPESAASFEEYSLSPLPSQLSQTLDATVQMTCFTSGDIQTTCDDFGRIHSLHFVLTSNTASALPPLVFSQLFEYPFSDGLGFPGSEPYFQMADGSVVSDFFHPFASALQSLAEPPIATFEISKHLTRSIHFAIFENSVTGEFVQMPRTDSRTMAECVVQLRQFMSQSNDVVNGICVNERLGRSSSSPDGPFVGFAVYNRP